MMCGILSKRRTCLTGARPNFAYVMGSTIGNVAFAHVNRCGGKRRLQWASDFTSFLTRCFIASLRGAHFARVWNVRECFCDGTFTV